jgi:CheY-like chemotaxis protein
VATATLRELKAIGVKLTLDDFGTGYSSLSYLQQFPVDQVKIDRSFVRDVTTNPSDAAICRAVIELAHALQLRVIGEGIETAGQLNYLRMRHCDEMQGYYFSRPVPVADYAQMLHEGRTLALAQAGAGPERTLLVVDDEPNILAALQRLFRRSGFQVLAATSGREGLELLAEHRVQVVLSDQRMPEMSGTEFLARVRSLYPETIRMILTGYTDLDTVVGAINRGTLFKFLTKPWDEDALCQQILEAFQYYELRLSA